MKELTCIVCPRGCPLKIDDENGEIRVSGNFCKRGEKFAVDEMTCPKRTICTTVKTVFPEVPVLPVRVSTDIPKDTIFAVMKEINSFVLERRVDRGEVIIADVLDTGADVIATSAVLKEVQ